MIQQAAGDRTAACVLAVDDHARFRSVLRDVVGATSDLVVVGEADSGERAVDLVDDLAPDLVLMDLRMPGMGGLAATRKIKELKPSTVVVLVSSEGPEMLKSAQGVADEVLCKTQLRPKVLDEIWRRHRGAQHVATSA
jgi:two-component system nitrate/nitrite response regulator NarL